jgi:hypothetical protein
MRQPQQETSEEALRQMRRLWFTLIVSFALFVWIGETMPGYSWLAFPSAGKIFVLLAAFNLVSLFWFWRERYSPALGAIRSQPQDINVVRKVEGFLDCAGMHGKRRDSFRIGLSHGREDTATNSAILPAWSPLVPLVLATAGLVVTEIAVPKAAVTPSEPVSLNSD